jgi:hypothetical protein
VVVNLSKSGLLPDGFPDLSVNERTDAKGVPPCDIPHVFDTFLAHAYRLRLKYPQGHLAMGKVDVADAFRQLLIHPDFASFFSYVWEDFLIVDLRLAFGWMDSPGYFYRWAKKMVEFINSLRPSNTTADVDACWGLTGPSSNRSSSLASFLSHPSSRTRPWT